MPRYRVFVRSTPPGGGTSGTAATERARRNALTIGTYKPDDTTTGLLAGTAGLTTFNGNITAVTNQVIENLIINGIVFFPNGVSGVTVRNCWIRGTSAGPGGQHRGLVHCTGATHASPVLIEDCLLEPQTPDEFWDGVRTHDFHARRCRIRLVTDTFGVFHETTAPAGTPTNVFIEGCYVGPFTRWATSVEHPTDGTHNDGVQIQGGDGTIIRGNRFEGYFDSATGDSGGLNRQTPQFTTVNSCVQFSDDVGPITNVTIENNWFYGSEIGLNASHANFNNVAGATGGTIQNNLFDHGQTANGNPSGNNTWTINLDSNPVISFGPGGTNTNVYEDNGIAVQIRRA